MPWSALFTLLILICIFALGVRLLATLFTGQAQRLALIVWYIIGIVVLLSWLGVLPKPAWLPGPVWR
jgi:hypothetical protein